jgi:type I restriction enzyme M protein
MANPPFNVSGVDKERLEKDPRFALGTPNTDRANYLWIQIFYHSLNEKGRAGFALANSAADARATELEIRKKLIKAGAVDEIVSIGTNFFYTVTLPGPLFCVLSFIYTPVCRYRNPKDNTPPQTRHWTDCTLEKRAR